ncbi:hypothetical protein BU23DRAFT_553063 [Bimuria novae-zelandiae CBS 107.79]|uniref:Methyltransferase n=1 Tax=Bimuria novae-zelandiae CBS 107.79 TaxID=1447943 RepID=A0A6A5VIB6_9PLEO|nr:hypothetical protein BU23DRAFT_553063 [Bimuria novae-zelandiae CBS 107.79]
MPDNLLASVRYVAKNPTTPADEKGYILHYAAPPGFPQNNFKIEPHNNIKMHDLRTSSLSYAENGIKITRINSEGMQPELFDDDDWIETVYLPELHRSLCETLGAKDVTIFDWMLRKRAASFPQRNVGDENEEQAQPSLSAHIDYTTDELAGRLEQYFDADKEKVSKSRYQVIKCAHPVHFHSSSLLTTLFTSSIWKPLSGPCRDFPMAYLDPTTVDRQNDLYVVDEVFPTVANEVFQVHYNPAHKWYWVPDQLACEIAIFMAYDSERGQEIAVPHCSFDLGERGEGEPRKSIEVRAFVFY